jgi:outer membrane protein OmpA-like peptidoglycan-associated protein
MRLGVARASIFGRSGSRVRCRMRGGSIRACAVRLVVGRRVIARGRGASEQTGRRSLTVTLRLTARGRALLARRLGGVGARVRAHATTNADARSAARPHATTNAGARSAAARTRAILRVERFATPPGSWTPDEASLTARGRRFVRGLRGKLIAVARVRCDGHDADARASSTSTLRLSLARARTMCDALRTLGVRPRTKLAGHGDSEPIASNATTAGRAKNRRVEVTLTHRQAHP